MTAEYRLHAVEDRLDSIKRRLGVLSAETLTWLNIDEAATYLRVSERTMRRAVASGGVKAHRVGGATRPALSARGSGRLPGARLT